jgi:CyaY protein
MAQESFDQRIDNTLLAIEEAIDEEGLDIDYDTISGILTLVFPDDSKIIINRQSATEQLWIAARSGGFHLDWQNDNWFCVSEDLAVNDLLNRLCSEQLGEPVAMTIEA